MTSDSQPCSIPQSTSPQRDSIYKRHALTGADDAVRFLRLESWEYPQNGEEGPTIFHCSFEVHTLSSKPHFAALSYEWGAADETLTDTVFINGVSWPLRRNLYDALQHVWDHRRRSEEDRLSLETEVEMEEICNNKAYVKRLEALGYVFRDGAIIQPLIWIDYLCIAQHDLLERNAQAALMRHIYPAAHTVVVWLGVATHDSAEAVRFLNSLYRFSVPSGWPSELIEHFKEVLKDREYRLKVLRPTNHLLSRSYWSRVWIIQEWVLARQILVMVGHDSFCICSRERSAEYVPAFEGVLREYGKLDEDVADGMGISLCFQLVRHTMDCSPGSEGKWKQLFVELVQNKQCYDPRDKIYGVLGLTNGSKSWPTVDYSVSLEDLYIDIIRRYSMLTFFVYPFAQELADSLGLDLKESKHKEEVDALEAKGKQNLRRAVGYR